jgi:hypothetical protein
MPSVSIISDLKSALQTTKRINEVLSDFKKSTKRIHRLYDDELPEPYLNAIDELLIRFSYRDMFLIIALLGNEKKLIKILGKSEDKPTQIIEKLFLSEW